MNCHLCGTKIYESVGEGSVWRDFAAPGAVHKCSRPTYREGQAQYVEDLVCLLGACAQWIQRTAPAKDDQPAFVSNIERVLAEGQAPGRYDPWNKEAKQ